MRAETLRAGKEERVRKDPDNTQWKRRAKERRRESCRPPLPRAPWSLWPRAEGNKASHLPLLHIPRAAGPGRAQELPKQGGPEPLSQRLIGITPAQPGGVGESPDSTLNVTCRKVRPVLLDPEQGQQKVTGVVAGAGPEAKVWS